MRVRDLDERQLASSRQPALNAEKRKRELVSFSHTHARTHAPALKSRKFLDRNRIKPMILERATKSKGHAPVNTKFGPSPPFQLSRPVHPGKLALMSSAPREGGSPDRSVISQSFDEVVRFEITNTPTKSIRVWGAPRRQVPSHEQWAAHRARRRSKVN